MRMSGGSAGASAVGVYVMTTPGYFQSVNSSFRLSQQQQQQQHRCSSRDLLEPVDQPQLQQPSTGTILPRVVVHAPSAAAVPHIRSSSTTASSSSSTYYSQPLHQYLELTLREGDNFSKEQQRSPKNYEQNAQHSNIQNNNFRNYNCNNNINNNNNRSPSEKQWQQQQETQALQSPPFFEPFHPSFDLMNYDDGDNGDSEESNQIGLGDEGNEGGPPFGDPTFGTLTIAANENSQRSPGSTASCDSFVRDPGGQGVEHDSFFFFGPQTSNQNDQYFEESYEIVGVDQETGTVSAVQVHPSSQQQQQQQQQQRLCSNNHHHDVSFEDPFLIPKSSRITRKQQQLQQEQLHKKTALSFVFASASSTTSKMSNSNSNRSNKKNQLMASSSALSLSSFRGSSGVSADVSLTTSKSADNDCQRQFRGVSFGKSRRELEPLDILGSANMESSALLGSNGCTATIGGGISGIGSSGNKRTKTIIDANFGKESFHWEAAPRSRGQADYGKDEKVLLSLNQSGVRELFITPLCSEMNERTGNHVDHHGGATSSSSNYKVATVNSVMSPLTSVTAPETLVTSTTNLSSLCESPCSSGGYFSAVGNVESDRVESDYLSHRDCEQQQQRLYSNGCRSKSSDALEKRHQGRQKQYGDASYHPENNHVSLNDKQRQHLQQQGKKEKMAYATSLVPGSKEEAFNTTLLTISSSSSFLSQRAPEAAAKSSLSPTPLYIPKSYLVETPTPRNYDGLGALDVSIPSDTSSIALQQLHKQKQQQQRKQQRHKEQRFGNCQQKQLLKQQPERELEQGLDELVYWSHVVVARLKAFGNLHVQTGEAYIQCGNAHYHAKDFVSAQLSFQSAYRIFRDLHKPLGIALAMERMGMAILASSPHDSDSLQRAYTVLLEAFRIRQSHLGSWHADTVDCMNGIGKVHMLCNNFSEAKRCYWQVFWVRRAIFGSDHPSCAVAAHDLANLYLKLGCLQDATNFYQIALEVYDKLRLPKDNPSMARLIRDFKRLHRIAVAKVDQQRQKKLQQP